MLQRSLCHKERTCKRAANKHHTCRACRGAPQDEALCLREGDVASICQGSDAQAAAVANVLTIVSDLRVADVHLFEKMAFETGTLLKGQGGAE